MQLSFTGEIVYWRGPSPYHFVDVPEEEAEQIHAVSSLVTYGWGVIPARVTIGVTRYETSLFPREGGYVVPVRVSVRKAEGLELGDVVDVALRIGE
jgi:Domain of unknown function (DUF1905)